MPHALTATFTLVAHGVALMLLLAGWSPKKGIVRLPFMVGVFTLLQAMTGWFLLCGAEFGTIYWLLSSSVGGWLGVAVNVRRGPAANPRVRPASMDCLGSTRHEFFSRYIKRWRKGSFRLLVAGPLYLICALCLSLLIVRYLPVEPANAWITAALLLPLFWAGGLVFTVASERFERHALWSAVGITATLPFLVG